MERVALTTDQRRRATTTGALAHVIFAVGVWLGITSALLLLVAALSTADDRDSIARNSYGVDAATGMLLLGVGLIVSLALIAGSIVLSGRLLTSGGLRSPWAITWSALGICAGADFVLSGIFTFVSYASSYWEIVDRTLFAVIGTIVVLVVVAVVGAVFWRLMASAFRGYVVQPTPTTI